jgi:hydrogenase/urease accessory protein HupE
VIARLVPSLVVLVALLFSAAAFAHEVRPAYLELREEKPGEFSVLWKTPMLGDARLSLEPEFSGDAKAATAVTTRNPPGAAIQQWTLRAPTLRGQTLRIRGLEGTMTDALARIEFADGTTWTQRLTAKESSASIPMRQSGWSVGGVYLKLGVEHILTGLDHLLFVLALIIITRGGWKLLKTVTAFTISHSITLTAATLGFVRVPQPPVEAVIALSIMFVACEIVHRRQGRSGLTERWPWIVALTFGLLHGLGFAGALSEVGLPAGHIPLALLFFSVGVEVGQLLFITAVLALIRLWQVASGEWRVARWVELVPPYAIGTVAMFWVIQRIAAF